jgi:hypothetical protein
MVPILDILPGAVPLIMDVRQSGGSPTDVAGIEAGVSSPVAYRWFKHAGGVNPCLPPTVSGRYLSFSEREDIAIWNAQKIG